MSQKENEAAVPTAGIVISRICDFLEKISKICFSMAKWLLILCMIGIFSLVILQVVCRYLLHLALLWPENIVRWLLVWAAYLGASIALREGGHISLSFLVERFPQTLQFWILLLGKGVVLFFLIFFSVYGYKMAVSNPAFAWQVGLSYKWPMLGLPLTGSFMIVHILLNITKDVARLTEVPLKS